MRPLGGSAISCAPAVANTSRLRCNSISSPSAGKPTSVPPAVSLIVPSALVRRPSRRAIQAASSGSNCPACGGHLLANLGCEAVGPSRLERRQVVARERHEKRLMPAVRHEAVALVQVAQLLVDVHFFLGLLRPEVAERERGGLQHAVPGRVAADRPARGPRHAALDVHAVLLLEKRRSRRRDSRSFDGNGFGHSCSRSESSEQGS